MSLILSQFSEKIEATCKKYHVHQLYLYGSLTTAKFFSNASQVDLIVRFKDQISVDEYAELYFGQAADLEQLLNKKVDLMTEKPVKNPYLRKSMEESKARIYARAS
jgi:predicted nucleotidyltransferase